MLNILVVDDSESYVAVLARFLERFGYSVFPARDGAQAIGILASNPIDIVITDIIMPVMDGLELIMQTRLEFPDIPIIAMSGGGRNEANGYLRMARQLGASRALEKPFELSEISAALGEILA